MTKIFCACIGIRKRDFEVCSDHSERITKFVTCFVNELPLTFECFIETTKHVVERVGELAKFIVRSTEINTLLEITRLNFSNGI